MATPMNQTGAGETEKELPDTFTNNGGVATFAFVHTKKKKKNNKMIPDRNLSSGIAAVFGRGNRAFLYSLTNPHKNVTDLPRPPTAAPAPPHLHEVHWSTEMHNDVTRRLVNESRNIFLDLQKMAKDKSNTAGNKEFVQFSRQYRAVIKACTIALQQDFESTEDVESRESYQNQIELWDMIEMIWSLSEIIFIEMPPAGLVLLRLMDWLKWHFPEGDKAAHSLLQAETPEHCPEYWQAVFTFVLQGRVEEVQRLLRVHSQRDSDLFIYAGQLLNKMPVYKNHSNMSLPEFELRWRHWQEECIGHVEDGVFATNQNLEKIARLLSGEPEAFLELHEYCEPWYHMLFSMLYYQNPTITATNIQHHAQTCIDVCAGDQPLSPLDQILLSVLEMDPHLVIADCSRYFRNWWFVSHMTDLLHHCGVELGKEKSGCDLREYLLLDYGASLMGHDSLWQVGVGYFDHCPEYGRQHLELYLERVPIETEKKANKLLRICQQRDMNELAQSICKVLSRQALANGRLGTALSWCLKSKDVSFATYLSQKFLDDYIEQGRFRDLDLIDNMGSSMLLSSKLTFLGKYREFHKLYESGDLGEAAALLLSLLTAKLAPKKFWLTLLTDALPLLEAKELVLSSQQTYELLHCLEEITLTDKAHSITDNKTLDPEKIALLRLALTRNLARATLHEPMS